MVLAVLPLTFPIETAVKPIPSLDCSHGEKGYSAIRSEISVILPFHVVDSYLENAINSLSESRGVDLHIILVDDTPKLVRPTLPKLRNNRITLIRSGGVGYGRAMRQGLDRVDTDYVAFQDSDDETHNARLISQIHMLNKSNSDISICALQRISAKGRRSLVQPPIFQDSRVFRLSNLLGSNNSNSSWVLRSELACRSDFFAFNYQSIDWATTLNLEQSVKVIVSRKRMYRYRSNYRQMTKNQKYLDQAFLEIYPLWKKLNDEFNLPNLAISEAAMIAAPWSNLQQADFFPIYWVREYLKLPIIQESSDFQSLSILILGRIIRSAKLNGYAKAIAINQMGQFLLRSKKRK